jgi:DNA-binding LacI/PurR family transcriptional regulator
MSKQPPHHGKISRQARIGLKELSAQLGLSQATVSRVINGSATAHRISAVTQQRVLALAASLDYKAHVLAAGLRNRRTSTVGVLVPEISEGYSTTVLSGIEDALLKAGYFYFVVSHRHRKDLLREYPRMLIARAVEGIIAVDSAIEKDLPIPVVAVSGHSRHKSIVNIELDHMLAARQSLGHLKKLGHRQIAFIKGQTFSSDTAIRWKAICAVAAELGLRIDDKLTVQIEGLCPGTELGREVTLKLIERGHKFSAILAFNDLSAIGAITALHESGIHVPTQVSVVGFDDILSASTNNPALTTVRQPLYQMGEIAALTLLQWLKGEAASPPRQSIQVLPTFVERQSTCGVRKAISG